MDPVRTAGIWLGVGAGHVALLVAAWGMAGPAAPSDGGFLTLVLVAPESAPVFAATPTDRAILAATGPAPQPAISPALRISPARPPMPGPVSVRPGPAFAEAVGEPPGFVDRVEPRYPRDSRLAGREGVVRLRLRIGADGALRQIEIAVGSGDAALDRAAVTAATASTYRPARVGGRPVEAAVESTYRFELR